VNRAHDGGLGPPVDRAHHLSAWRRDREPPADERVQSRDIRELEQPHAAASSSTIRPCSDGWSSRSCTPLPCQEVPCGLSLPVPLMWSDAHQVSMPTNRSGETLALPVFRPSVRASCERWGWTRGHGDRWRPMTRRATNGLRPQRRVPLRKMMQTRTGVGRLPARVTRADVFGQDS
jgi:hypothetical protein